MPGELPGIGRFIAVEKGKGPSSDEQGGRKDGQAAGGGSDCRQDQNDQEEDDGFGVHGVNWRG